MGERSPPPALAKGQTPLPSAQWACAWLRAAGVLFAAQFFFNLPLLIFSLPACLGSVWIQSKVCLYLGPADPDNHCDNVVVQNTSGPWHLEPHPCYMALKHRISFATYLAVIFGYDREDDHIEDVC